MNCSTISEQKRAKKQPPRIASRRLLMFTEIISRAGLLNLAAVSESPFSQMRIRLREFIQSRLEVGDVFGHPEFARG
jgi:hypothetical protein